MEQMLHLNRTAVTCKAMEAAKTAIVQSPLTVMSLPPPPHKTAFQVHFYLPV